MKQSAYDFIVVDGLKILRRREKVIQYITKILLMSAQNVGQEIIEARTKYGLNHQPNKLI